MSHVCEFKHGRWGFRVGQLVSAYWFGGTGVCVSRTRFDWSSGMCGSRREVYVLQHVGRTSMGDGLVFAYDWFGYEYSAGFVVGVQVEL